MAETLPPLLAVNAYLGGKEASGPPSGDALAWGLGVRPPTRAGFLAAPPPADPADWCDPRVGWGLVLAENLEVPEAERATAVDAPEPIRHLVEARGHGGAPAPVLRYVPGGASRFATLRCYRAKSDLALDATPWGVGHRQMPRFLLIYGDPETVPWHLQSTLAAGGRCAGRLDLSEEEGLGRYVEHLLAEWGGSGRRVDSPVVWAVDDRATPITELMCSTVAAPLAERLAADGELAAGLRFIDGRLEEATEARLRAGLAEARPALLVTTSHGWTLPLDDPAALAADLGLPVDLDGARVTAEDLLGAWQPDGAVWFAQACCSAGSDHPSRYLTLLDEGSKAHRTVEAVAEAGRMVAPLPRKLLGAEKPLAAFVGHVEPTFDWTLRHPATRQHLADKLVEAFYDRLHQPAPVPLGHALQAWWSRIGALHSAHHQARLAFDDGEFHLGPSLTRDRLAAQDVESLVILGDPTVTIR